MARISSDRPLSADYLVLRSEASALGDHNDCSVKALALVANIPYAVAHARCAERGRMIGHGMYANQLLELMCRCVHLRRFAIDALIRTFPGQHKNLQNITSHHPVRFAKQWPKGTFVCFSTRHVFVVKDGVVHDWSAGCVLRVIAMYEVI